MADSHNAEHDDLVHRVKAIQRDGTTGRSKWHAYCEAQGKGTKDPSRHAASFLRSFLEAVQLGTIPDTQAGGLAAAPLPGDEDDSRQALSVLVAKVKNGQRASPEFKERWWTYCDTKQDGIRDPNRHDPKSLRHFLAEADDIAVGGYAGGAGAGSGRTSELVEHVKALQRQSDASKQQWWWYCDNFGAGVRDPSRHPEDFLQQFLVMSAAAQPGEATAATPLAIHGGGAVGGAGGYVEQAYGAFADAIGGYGGGVYGGGVYGKQAGAGHSDRYNPYGGGQQASGGQGWSWGTGAQEAARGSGSGSYGYGQGYGQGTQQQQAGGYEDASTQQAAAAFRWSGYGQGYGASTEQQQAAGYEDAAKATVQSALAAYGMSGGNAFVQGSDWTSGSNGWA